ncbi:transcriptional regulator [Lactobacillus crispatus]|nr:transcriptional regulator [Lactobacillus crispatus]
MPLTTNIAESSNITQQRNSSSNISLHNLTVALNLTIQDLFNFRKLSKEFNKTVLKIISWIKTTSIVPELGIIRELNAYFLAVYEGNISVSTNIKNVLKISGYQNLANDLPN